jgi:hypothetical protein
VPGREPIEMLVVKKVKRPGRRERSAAFTPLQRTKGRQASRSRRCSVKKIKILCPLLASGVHE